MTLIVGPFCSFRYLLYLDSISSGHKGPSTQTVTTVTDQSRILPSFRLSFFFYLEGSPATRQTHNTFFFVKLLLRVVLIQETIVISSPVSAGHYRGRCQFWPQWTGNHNAVGLANHASCLLKPFKNLQEPCNVLRTSKAFIQ